MQFENAQRARWNLLFFGNDVEPALEPMDFHSQLSQRGLREVLVRQLSCLHHHSNNSASVPFCRRYLGGIKAQGSIGLIAGIRYIAASRTGTRSDGLMRQRDVRKVRVQRAAFIVSAESRVEEVALLRLHKRGPSSDTNPATELISQRFEVPCYQGDAYMSRVLKLWRPQQIACERTSSSTCR